jgi:NADPH:quinone reductase-like Zn-dependent oxidoreductase
MKAWVLKEIGNLDYLELVEQEKPVPGSGEALLKVRAVSLNPRDLQIIDGYYPHVKELPLVPCGDAVFEVESIGDCVSRVKVGDRVCGVVYQGWLDGPLKRNHGAQTLGADYDGMLREYAVLDVENVIHVPDHLSDAEAATLPTTPITAWNALFRASSVTPGQTVLVQGTGGVAISAIQFAIIAGARVIVLTRGDKKCARALDVGAHVAVNSLEYGWVERILEHTNGEGVDHVIENRGELAESIRCLKIGGTIIQIGYMAETNMSVEAIALMLSNVTVVGIANGSRSMFEEMVAAINLHKIRPIVSHVLPFEQAPEAFRLLREGNHSGKIVIKLN